MYLILTSSVSLDFKSNIGDSKVVLRYDYIYTLNIDPKSKRQTNFSLMEGEKKRCDLKAKDLEIVLQYGVLTSNIEIAEKILASNQSNARNMVKPDGGENA